jgi:hypothetical protein
MDEKSALPEYENPGEGEAENVLALPDEEANVRYVFWGELDEMPLVYDCPDGKLSTSPLSDVAVV